MELSNGERLIIFMLSEVMEALKLNNEIDPVLVRSLVTDNAGWALGRKYPGIFHSESAAPSVVKETGDILWMWGIIESGISKLSGEQAAEAKGWHHNAFAGFDANNDPHYHVSSTMIRELGEFKDSRNGVVLNSHTQAALPSYRRMYAKFEGYVNAGQAAPLSFEALRDICG